MLRKSVQRQIEIGAWITGVSLLAAYVGPQAWFAYSSDKAIAAMNTARTAVASSSHVTGAENVGLALRAPDTSSWSPQRVAEYRALKGNALPEAVLRIPKLSLEAAVFEGTSEMTLNGGAGRIKGTARIDSTTGNIGLAAHRDGFFRPLQKIAIGDRITLDTLHRSKHYRVAAIWIVPPSEVSVLAATDVAALTLVTCYPFYHVGPAPQRYIVRANADPVGE